MKKLSNQQIAQLHTDKLKAWVKSNPLIPMYQGRVNKSEICRTLGITKSTIGSNNSLKKVFDDIEKTISEKPHDSKNILNSNTVKKMEREISRLENRVAVLTAENESLRKATITEQHFLSDGRLVRL